MKTLCIIDDDLIYQFTVKKHIQQLNDNLQILTFQNGEQAIIAFKRMLNSNQSLPDLILLDINMPVMDSWQFMEEFLILKHQVRKNVHIYITSSSLDQADISKAQSYLDVKGFLHKPIGTEILTRIIRECK